MVGRLVRTYPSSSFHFLLIIRMSCVGYDERFPYKQRIQQALLFARYGQHENLYAHPMVRFSLSIVFLVIRPTNNNPPSIGLHPRRRLPHTESHPHRLPSSVQQGPLFRYILTSYSLQTFQWYHCLSSLGR